MAKQKTPTKQQTERLDHILHLRGHLIRYLKTMIELEQNEKQDCESDGREYHGRLVILESQLSRARDGSFWDLVQEPVSFDEFKKGYEFVEGKPDEKKQTVWYVGAKSTDWKNGRGYKAYGANKAGAEWALRQTYESMVARTELPMTFSLKEENL